jgi:hypothetical protein
MKKLILNTALGFAALLAAGSSAFAATYDFSYQFAGDGAPNYVTGSFTGTGSVNDVTDIGNVKMSLDGSPLAGFNAWSYTPTSPNCGDASCFTLGGAVVSANSTLSNFVFSSASTNAELAASTYFYVIQPWTNGGQTVAAQYALGGSPNSYINYYNGQYAPANFSVTAVPEPAAWALMLLGVGVIGAGLRMARRKTDAALSVA